MIQIFITGGTFDKEYNLITGELFFKDTHLPQMLDRGRCTLDVDIKTLMMVDSLEMTEADGSEREPVKYLLYKYDNFPPTPVSPSNVIVPKEESP